MSALVGMLVASVAWLAADTEPFGSREAFDAASRAEILTYVSVLSNEPCLGEGPLRWCEQERNRAVGAYALASGVRVEWPDLVALARRTTTVLSHRAFWLAWVAEQIRLAQLFPDPTSEIFPMRSSDVSGGELPDRTFALTFDDGPSATTEATAKTLRELKLPATFFVLGEHLGQQRNASALYAGFCVASHGATHVAHTALDRASISIERTQQAMADAAVLSRADLFRPPYGQRSDAFAQWLEDRRVRTVLWNIDSQDWRGDARALTVVGRILALMLVRRRGVILFHDVRPVAANALPHLVRTLTGSDVKWVGCEAL